MSTPWPRRLIEEQGLFNPAFLALVLREGSDGYRQESGSGMPFALTFLLVPAVLNPTTRMALPKIITTSLAAWVTDHAYIRATFATRVRSLVPSVREGILLGLQSGLLSQADDRVLPLSGPRLSRGERQTQQTREVLGRARWVGRWFARAGTPETVFALFGVKP
jgi:Family of unknown function (DUF6521)